MIIDRKVKKFLGDNFFADPRCAKGKFYEELSVAFGCGLEVNLSADFFGGGLCQV